MKNPGFVPILHALQPLDGSPSQLMLEQRAEVEAMRLRCEKLVREAQERAVAIEAEAFQKGFDQGKAQGEAAGRKLFEGKVAEMEKLMRHTGEEKKLLVRRHEEALFRLVKAMVERLVGHELSVNPQVIRASLKTAMGYVVENATVRVRLHPEDFNYIREVGLADPDFLKDSAQVQLLEDPAVARGGCILESDFGTVDADIEALRTRLFNAVDKAFYLALAE